MKFLLVVLITNTFSSGGGFALDHAKFATMNECQQAAAAYKEMDTALSRIKTVCREIKP